MSLNEYIFGEVKRQRSYHLKINIYIYMYKQSNHVNSKLKGDIYYIIVLNSNLS